MAGTPKSIKNKKNDTNSIIDGKSLTRTISVESIAPKISQLFKRKRKRPLNEDDSVTSTPADTPRESDAEEDDSIPEAYHSNKHHHHHNNNNNTHIKSPATKRRKVKTKEEEEFEENEKKLDAELPEELRKYRPAGFKFNLPPKDRPIRIYADGVFDLFHLGHMRQLEQAKKSFENVELVCGVPSDIETHKRKGLTVLSDQQRCDTLKHCRWVDEVIPNAPWCVTTDFLKEHNIDYVAHDDLPYASGDSDDIYKPIKEKGMFLTTQRTEGISTSDIITKIIRDYDKYLMRNFARGATRKELNVSWLKKNELDLKKHISDFRTYWEKNRENFNNVSRDLYFEIREFMRGKKFDVQSFLESSNQTNSDSEDNQSRVSSPLTDFAAKYMGNANKDLNGRSIFANVREWIIRDDHDDFSNDDDEDNETMVTKSSDKKLTKIESKASNKSTTSSATTTPKKARRSSTTKRVKKE
ncbi:cytidylyltransferase-domain-containing protein [Scheffersomyces coipomensis]|uniref:cytidylyltransferase-domain-containing protein n=1 Tax=Scheffersomyces coipomensis TaxID=1788519 RepID=UPI00315D19D0